MNAAHPLTEKDLIQNHVYEAKRKSKVGFPQKWNDRQILFIGRGIVQYDSPSISNGRHYVTKPIADFLKWAGRDITKEMPKGFWREA